MSLRWRRFALFLSAPFAFAIASCGSAPSEVQPPTIKIVSIVVDGGGRLMERGTKLQFTATAFDSTGKAVSVPFVWRSSNEAVASFDANALLIAHDTGTTYVTASALGVTSAANQVLVSWLGIATIDTFHWNPPNAVIPGVKPADSIRVSAVTLTNHVAVGTLIAFKVTGGAGTVSPAYVTVGTSGIAAAEWTLGPANGLNTVTATAISTQDSTVLTYVKNNPVTFSVKTYTPLTVVQGDAQSGSILSALPVIPIVKLVDTAGKPRPGIPITFAPTGNGRVGRTVVPTGVDGTASPGVWTLGDLTGDQQLVVSVESAKLTIHATAAGGTVHFAADQIATSEVATCTLTNPPKDQFVSCMGRVPQIGTGDTTNQSTPTLTKGNVQFTTLVC